MPFMSNPAGGWMVVDAQADIWPGTVCIGPFDSHDKASDYCIKLVRGPGELRILPVIAPNKHLHSTALLEAKPAAPAKQPDVTSATYLHAYCQSKSYTLYYETFTNLSSRFQTVCKVKRPKTFGFETNAQHGGFETAFESIEEAAGKMLRMIDEYNHYDVRLRNVANDKSKE